MEVYLVQHAEAISEEEDPARPLSDVGRRHAEAVAEMAARLGVEVWQIRHSGKTRAEQTAEIMGAALDPGGSVLPVEGLSPLDDVEPVADELEGELQPVMLVGHLPFMERLAAQLIVGDDARPVIGFTNAAIVRLVKKEEGWRAAWILTPEMAEVAA